jgi:ribosomal protein RSM22 (predicted rRNA methylase)
MDVSEPLRMALATRLTGLSTDALRTSVERLIEAYRSGDAPPVPILATETDVAAYAAYRMPATYAAVRAALAALERVGALSRAPVQPTSLLDIGGGTGAATWAAVDAFPMIETVTILDQVTAALDFGADLALGSPSPVLRGAVRQTRTLPGSDPLPAADLVTISYVLGELPAANRLALIDAADAAAGALVVIEPGTPAGYDRVIAARSRMIALGRTIVAPCPHQQPCPMPPGRDWCHFGTRVNRSSLHRRLKDAELSYEDEKFSYVVGVAPDSWSPWASPDAGRVLRRPTQRKGLVQLRLCAGSGELADRIVSKRQGADYRAARDLSWGDLYLPSSPIDNGQ